MSDAQSLSLPKPGSKTRTKRKKWKKPPPKFWWLLGWTLWAAYVSVSEFIWHRPVHGVWVMIVLASYWTDLIRIKEGRPELHQRPHGVKLLLLCILAWYGGLALMDVLGIK